MIFLPNLKYYSLFYIKSASAMSNTPAYNRSVEQQTLTVSLWLSASESRQIGWMHNLDRAGNYARFVEHVAAAADNAINDESDDDDE